MLRHLRVTNFAILSDVTLELGEGMNALTGETGAGKSLIVEAVNLLRGGRASADIPRAGADEAVVEAIFEVPDDLEIRIRGVLDGAGLPLGPDDDGSAKVRRSGGEPRVSDVLVRRVIQRGGRSRTYVNGALTTAGRLAELGSLLVDLSGQHQHQGLVDPNRHREILDVFASVEAAEKADAKAAKAGPSSKAARALPAVPLLQTMDEAWQALRAIDTQIEALGGDERARSERADYLRYQLDELDGARLEVGEDDKLGAERTRLAAVDQLQAGARAAEDLLYGGDDSAIDRLAAASRELERLLRLDGDLEPCARLLNEARALVEDVASQLRHYADRLEGDPERLSWVEDRLELIRRLVRKHGIAVGELIGRAGELRTELDGLDRRDVRLAELTASRAAAEARAMTAARALTESRSQAARRLEREVAAALAELGMAAARLHVVIEPRPLGATGADRVELMLASNKGEDKKPLARVASGGELSRIMLAMKLVLRRADEVATYVFDEVDTGVGGATASAVGAQIRAVADHRQVLCVTHLPQLAAYADHHFHVEKSEVGGRTETRVKKLGAGARKDELARMLGGQATTKARAHAAELLADAARVRPRAQAS